MAPSISRITNPESNTGQPDEEYQRPVLHQNAVFTSALDFVQQLCHPVILPPVPSHSSESNDEVSPSTPILPGSYPKSAASSPIVDLRLELPPSPSVSTSVTSDSNNHEACATAIQDGNRTSQPPSTAPGLPISATTAENIVSALQGAHNFTVRDRARITNIGVNHYVTSYGGTIDIDVMKKFMEEFVSFNAVHDSPVQDPTRQCHPETRRAVLKQLQDWIDDPDATESICWLHGPAGVGKSAIAQTIARSCSRDKVPATFFFYKSDPGRNDGNRLFTTLAWQLALSIPGFKTRLIDTLTKRPDLARKDIETQFEELITRPLQALNEISSQTPLLAPIIIIDGVDECVDERLQQRILKVIGSTISQRRIPLRFLFCSRPEAHIQETVNSFQCPTLPLDLSKLDDANKDIEKYLKAEFSCIASEQDLDPSWPGEEIIQKFVYKASGQFIYASTLIRFINDEYSCATTQLDIVLGLKMSEAKKPFVELDVLYREILKRQPDWNFLNDILSISIGHFLDMFYTADNIKLYAILMNLSQKELRRKLRGMHSLLKLEPSFDIYHRSFLDFLEDSSRSGQYHISQQAAEKRSLDIIMTSIVRHVPIVLEQPDRHEQHLYFWIDLDWCALSVEELQAGLQPLAQIHVKLLNMEKSAWQQLLQCGKCNILFIVRDLLLYLACRQEASKHETAHPAQVVEQGLTEHAGMFGPLTPLIATEVEQTVLEMSDVDVILSSVLVHLRETELELPLSAMTVDLMCSLLSFNCVETAMRVRSISDGQLLVDVIDYLINNEDFPSQHDATIVHKAARLALEVHARVPVLPRSMFCSSDLPHHSILPWYSFTSLFTPAFMARILDRNYVLRVLWTFKEGRSKFVYESKNTCEPIREWRRSTPGLVKMLQVMLEIAKAIQYVDAMDVLLYSSFDLRGIFLDSERHVKISPLGYILPMTRISSKELHQMNVFTLGCIFYELYFDMELYRKKFQFEHDMPERLSEPEINDELWQLIQQCYATDPKSRPTINKVVQEMESWKID